MQLESGYLVIHISPDLIKHSLNQSINQSINQSVDY